MCWGSDEKMVQGLKMWKIGDRPCSHLRAEVACDKEADSLALMINTIGSEVSIPPAFSVTTDCAICTSCVVRA